MSLSLLLLVPALHAADVTVSWSVYDQLRPPVVETVVGPGPAVLRRDVVVTPVDGGLQVRSTWQLLGESAGWLPLDLVQSSAHVGSITWQGSRIDGQVQGGTVRVVVLVDGPGELVLDAFVPGDPGEAPMVLSLAPAPLGTLVVPELAVVDTVQVDGTWWSGQQRLVLQPPARVVRREGALVVAHGGLGLTVHDDVVAGHARVVWEVRQGKLSSVSFRLTDAGQDLDVTGPGLLAWQRSGDRITATLQAPTDGRIALEARWTRPVPQGTEASLPLPVLTPEGATRADVSLQLARDGELEVLPVLPRWDAVPRSSLPEWGQDLVAGAPTATYVAPSARAGTLQLLRFKPVEAPAVVVDVAAHTVAATQEGRVLARSLFQVRNERASHLRVSLPPGSTLVGVRVGPGIATPVSDDSPGVLVPLLRSVETVEGLVSFPVEVIWYHQDAAWDDKAHRSLTLPTVDAPIGVVRTTVHLPRGFRETGGLDLDHRVTEFSEGDGITYGFATGDPDAVVADQLFQTAVTNWLENDFDEAQQSLSDLRALGAESEDIDRLESNLEILFSSDEVGSEREAKADKSAERRIKAQARARSSKKELVQKEKVSEAEEAEREGDYGRAEELYLDALEIGEELAVLEDDESVEQAALNQSYSQNLVRLDEKQEVSAPSQDPGWWDVDDAPADPEFLDFSGMDESWLEFDGSEPVMIGGQLIGTFEGEEVIVEGYGLGSHGSGAGGGGFSGSASGQIGGYGVVQNAAAPAPAPPAVTASALTVTIPAAGQAVYYQRLLLPAGATSDVVLVAERVRVSWRSR
jgi:hypothetical protein